LIPSATADVDLDKYVPLLPQRHPRKIIFFSKKFLLTLTLRRRRRSRIVAALRLSTEYLAKNKFSGDV